MGRTVAAAGHLTVLADATGTVDLSVFAQYGALGILAAALLWYAKGATARERDQTDQQRARADRLEAEVQRLNSLIADRAIPALMAASRAAEESAALLSAVQREREITKRSTKGDA